MQALNAVLLLSDAGAAQSLVSLLSDSLGSIHLAHDVGEVRTDIAKQEASLDDVKSLAGDFPEAHIVCTHRCADEEMWTAALNAGAEDVCRLSDTTSIVRAAMNCTQLSHSLAA